jgi:hypothetical protein
VTADIIELRPRRGRPSTARLAEIREQVADARDELTALVAEGADFGTQVVQLARLSQMRMARGASPADLLDELEHLGLRHQNRMTAARAHLRPADECPDGQVDAPHGAAA